VRRDHRRPRYVPTANLDEDARCELHVLVVDVEMLGKEEEELGRVQVGAGADDAIDWLGTRQLQSDVRWS
jgi:hypothetical protein